MNNFLDELSKKYGIDIIFKKANENAEDCLKAYEQLIYKKLNENKEVK